MNAQDLKNSILQLAVQGKLVEQRPEEGTAKELLAQIKSEKEQLINDKKIKKEKSLPNITDEEIPFDIPESWEWVRLSEVVEMIMGQSPKGTDVMEGGNGIEFHQGKVYFGSDYLEISPQTTSKPTKIVEPNTTLLCVRAPVGTANITERQICIGRGLCGLIPYNKMESKFILNWIRAFKNDLIRKATGTTFIAITGDVVREQVIPLPPLAEQKRIVAKIEEILPYIEQYDKAYTKLEAFNKKFPEDMKKSILQMAMQGKLVEQRPEEGTADELYEQIVTEKTRLIKEGKIKKEKPLVEISEDEIPFDIPESWKWVRWGNLSYSIQYGYNAPALEAGRIKMVRISDIQNNEVLWDTVPYCEISDAEIETYLLAPNDILFARTGGTVGKSYLVKEVPEDAVYAGYLIRTRYSELLSPQYMKFFMESQLYWQQLRNGTIATAQPNCNGKTLGNMIIPLPPLAEQKRIVAKLEQMLPYCDRLIK